MKENVGKFFEIYASDPAVRGRVEANIEAYPGSYEIREALTDAHGYEDSMNSNAGEKHE